MAIKKSEVATKLRTLLQEGETHFVFIKKDGSRRHTFGTLNLDLVPEADKQFKHHEEEKEERTDQITFYDTEKFGWRTCKVDSVVEINGEIVEED